MLKRLLAEERLALLFGAIYLLLDAAWWWLFAAIWIGVVILSLLFWILALSFAIGRGIDAWKEPRLRPRQRARRIIAIPLMLFAVVTLVRTVDPGARLAASVALKVRAEEMRQAQLRLGPDALRPSLMSKAFRMAALRWCATQEVTLQRCRKANSCA